MRGSWRLATGEATLAHDEVHVWCARLDLPPERLASLEHTLCEEERARARRYRFERDRRRFIAGRGQLRLLLGCYTGTQPSRIEFRYGPQGKPALTEVGGARELRFNVSHSHELALYAVTLGRGIGVDVERIRPEPDLGAIAEQLFSLQERSVLRSLPPDLQPDAFFTCWTRKEAFLKAKGNGLSLPLDQFDVSVAPGEPARLLRTQWDPREADHWSLRELAVDSGYKAALAVEGHDWRLLYRLWRDP